MDRIVALPLDHARIHGLAEEAGVGGGGDRLDRGTVYLAEIFDSVEPHSGAIACEDRTTALPDEFFEGAIGFEPLEESEEFGFRMCGEVHKLV